MVTFLVKYLKDQIMKLYDVPRNSYVRVSDIQNEDKDKSQSKGESSEVRIPSSAPSINAGQLILFDHIDGMYSLCYEVDEVTLERGNSCHIAAWTEVELVDPDECKPFEEIRDKIGRSGFGKDGTGEYRQAKLSEMNDDWVKASINFIQDDHPHKKYYIQELKYREDNNITIEDLEDDNAAIENPKS